ncbi:polysaccharide deacetylase family protein [Alkalicoccobacillus murimartini]|uniref:Peptidoglycan/xylan/chitin deacetylase (PgdA/CDA1 family) n=1 Tax=Alkalicoccobacillus murimartini TaxID=171685 RepID=A0ABT9YF81_9BACI|nr:polysaccharide deacetylase family protein [Alkalicoccobacillus murimartini]MDQ0206497.1 peptidoglycan/xylan/chitin deacetylase (PgdA/CDA1 family) [Alkalicoccobacillus murimartini]
MKKAILYSSLSVVLLSACTNGAQEAGGPEEETEVPDQQEEQPEDETEIETEEEEESSEPADDADEEEVEVEVEPEYEINDVVWTVDPIDDANPQVVLATFDDAPDQHAVEMAETLKENDVPAIFFVNGHFLDTDEEKEMLKEIHNMGFPIGNHTMTHQDLKSISEEEQYEEIIEVSDIVEDIIGERPRFFRAPFGSNTDYSRELVEEEGMILMNWTYGYDWEPEYQDAEALADIMVNTEFLQNGANLLMHDREWTNEALQDIIDGLRDQDYEFVDPELIK